MTEQKISNFRPIHSDFIIHWTGKDIEEKFNDHKTKIEKYLERLRAILNYGLWMTIDEEEKFITDIGGEMKIERPLVPRTCFTELKLSEVSIHAERFGKLGIGFKRFFLFNRLGGPVVYFPLHVRGRENWFFPPLFSSGLSNQFRDDDYFSCFLKPMYVQEECLEYKYYNESEWRIIYSEEIKRKLIENKKSRIVEKFKHPKDYLNIQDFQSIYDDATKKPLYLIPFKENKLDSIWFSMIIYPDIQTKVASEADQTIRNILNEIKPNNTQGYLNSKPALYERFSKVIEIDLRACGNF